MLSGGPFLDPDGLDWTNFILGQGEPPIQPDVVLTSSLRNMQLLMSGKLSKMRAYVTGKLKVEGDKNAAFNLDKVIDLVQQS